ncbi:ATP-binding protein [Nonomuraea jabiensis]|uniref:Anti-sigma regulatory factor (Ser/Thr protein kinase) n=1 Tax=Nonomuraea jabiensis TaxID=882448 RepID=A0A7W9L7T9_9ACTN|nr:ATP-binding protein [Nonomuraea jabiensis]MBB5773848.1 anti-sigma regulatory factor (Ser/Thr protein kinase) [Nonomuraea jabiensis]
MKIRAGPVRQDQYAPHRARLAVRAWLGSAHSALYDTELVASELVTNAVRHSLEGAGRDWARLLLAEAPSRVRLVVTDPGNPTSPG